MLAQIIVDVCARTNTSFTLEVRRIILDSPQDILGTRTLTRYDELLLSKGATTVRTTKAHKQDTFPMLKNSQKIGNCTL